MTDQPDPMVDAGALLAMTAELREVHARVEGSSATPEQKRRWQRRLAEIAEAATVDLEEARGQLRRFVAQLDRSPRA